jgi:hypothetical protein
MSVAAFLSGLQWSAAEAESISPTYGMTEVMP